MDGKHLRGKTIAVCLGGIDEEYNDIYAKRLNQQARRYDCHIIYFYSFSTLHYEDAHDAGEKKIFDLINYDMLDAIIIMPNSFRLIGFPPELLTLMRSKNLPIISLEEEKEGCYTIYFDEDITLAEIISHVIEVHGAKKINFLGGIKGEPNSERRLAVFKRVMKEHGLTVEEGRIGYGEFWDQPAAREMQAFLDSGLEVPDAIICANDTMAITAYNCLMAAGYHVPDDVIVTGFDGLLECLHHDPVYTTAMRNLEDLADRSICLLDTLFSDEEKPDTEKKKMPNLAIAPKMILGGTCGCSRESADGIIRQNSLIRSMNNSLASRKYFILDQIRMAANLIEVDSFERAFESIKSYIELFVTSYLSISLSTEFLSEEEFSDIVEDTGTEKKNMSFTPYMRQMICRRGKEWAKQGTVYETKELLPDYKEVLEEYGNLFFFPLHIHERIIGYGAAAFENDIADFIQFYHFFMNISNTMELTESKQRQQTIIENLENKYIHDPLTGLFNRRGFYQNASVIFKDCVEQGRYIQIVSVDLNGLKPINDTYGHADGDIAITAVAKSLAAAAKTKDVCARFGGDEFVVAAYADSEEDGEGYARRVVAKLADFNQESNKPYMVSCSIGSVVVKPDEDSSLDALIKLADESMYEEKERYHRVSSKYRR